MSRLPKHDVTLSKMLRFVEEIPRDDLEIFAAEILSIIRDPDLIADDMLEYMIESADHLLEKH